MKTPLFHIDQALTASTPVPHYVEVFVTGFGRTVREQAEQPFPVAGTLQDFSVHLGTAPGVGASWKFDIYKNGSVTAITITISDTNTTGTSSDTLAVLAGDLIVMLITPSAGPAPANSTLNNCIVFNAAVKKSVILGGTAGAALINSSTQYQAFSGGSSWNGTEVNRSQVAPTAGTIKNLYVNMASNPGGGTKGYKFTVYKNGLATALTATISGSNVTASDTSNSFSVVAGDLLSMESVPQNSPSNAIRVHWATEFNPTVDGESMNLSGGLTPDNTSITYGSLDGATTNNLATETLTYAHSSISCVFKTMYVSLTAAPGAGNSYTFALRKNASTQAMSVQIADAATTGNSSSTVSMNSTNNINYICTPFSSPTTPSFSRVSFTVFVQSRVNGLFDFFESSGGNSRELCH